MRKETWYDETVKKNNLMAEKNYIFESKDNKKNSIVDSVYSFNINSTEKPFSKIQTVKILGSNLVYELKDLIYCFLNVAREMEQSTCKINDPSLILIENLMLYDDRYQSSLSFANEIYQWILEKSKDPSSRYSYKCSDNEKYSTFYDKKKYFIGPISPNIHLAPMSLSINKLKINLNVPYIFIHFGNCEHLITFFEISPKVDNDQNTKYPLILYQIKHKRKKCYACDLYPANYLVVNDIKIPFDPCYFCQRCFLEFHYSIDGRLFYNEFKVYNYLYD